MWTTKTNGKKVALDWAVDNKKGKYWFRLGKTQVMLLTKNRKKTPFASIDHGGWVTMAPYHHLKLKFFGILAG